MIMVVERWTKVFRQLTCQRNQLDRCRGGLLWSMRVEIFSSNSESYRGYTGLKGPVNRAFSDAGLSNELYVGDVIDLGIVGEVAIWDT